MHSSKYSTMKCLPDAERPYEKCEKYGPGVLSDAELLAVILRTGSEGLSALDMSRELLKRLEPIGLCGLCNVSSENLRLVRGVGRVKALQIRCIAELSARIAKSRIGYAAELSFNDPKTVADYFMEDMRHRTHEVVLLLCLSSKGKLLYREYISRGTIDSAVITPREVFVVALSHNAASVILLHNHPSGDPTPSQEDIRITQMVAEAGTLIGIPLLDHIVIGDHRMISLRESHLLTRPVKGRCAEG